MSLGLAARPVVDFLQLSSRDFTLRQHLCFFFFFHTVELIDKNKCFPSLECQWDTASFKKKTQHVLIRRPKISHVHRGTEKYQLPHGSLLKL